MLEQDFVNEISAFIASPERTDLPGQLEEIARLVAGLPGIQGGVVVALDPESQPLTSGAHGLSLRHEGSQLDTLFQLRLRLGAEISRPGWSKVPAALVARNGHVQSLVLPVESARNPAGLILVSAEPGECAQKALDLLRANGPLLAAAIQSSIRSEAWSRIERLQDLAKRTFILPNWDLKGLVRELAELFWADAVTILLEELGVLRLSASTDERLGEEEEVVYRPGQGLTGYVFATGKPLRLSNSRDFAEIERETGTQRKGPSHPERDSAGALTGQFLGIPMMFGAKVVGVLRMSRKGGSARFTQDDEKALQLFADLLGAALAPSWSLLFGRSVLDSINEAIAVSRREPDDRGGAIPRIIMANPGAAEILKLPREMIEGLDAREIYAPGEYRRIRQGLGKALTEAKEKGKSEYGPIETRLVRADGSFAPVILSFRILANRLVVPNTLYTIGLARDTSESERRARQHARLLDLLDAIEVAYFQADQNGVTREPTTAESRITGYSLEELDGLNREKLYIDPDQRHLLLERARRNRGQLVQVVQSMVRKDGTPIWVQGDLRIVKEADQEAGLEGLYRDVTDRIRLQIYFNEGTERVLRDDELFERLKRDAKLHLDYMSSLGHQLQTPMGSLIETLRNFRSGVVNQRQLMNRLPYAIGQAAVCTRLVRNLSYMDKILRGEPFERERVSLAKLAIETKLDFLHQLHEKRIDFQIDDESLDQLLQVQGHPEMLRQVVVNLVDNAIKYSLRGSKIRIRARTWPAGPCFEISNRGLSISGENREKIFERGFRSPKAKALVPHGTGLGLWLVRKILEAHQATIRCHEVIEEAETRVLFRITFPNPNNPTPRRT